MKRRRWIHRTLLPSLVAACVTLPSAWLLSGCNSDDAGPAEDGRDIRLNRCPSCESLERYVKGSAIRMLESS